jgi:hypothetical protein
LKSEIDYIRMGKNASYKAANLNRCAETRRKAAQGLTAAAAGDCGAN